MPNCKIITITALNEVFIVYDIAKKVRPDALIIKNDITPEKLQHMIMELMKGNHDQSPTVKNALMK
ncbi:hypothetical protein MCETHM1_01273 [Flavobacteriaceae bacterium]